jgi:hypothetical protein
MVRKMRFMAYRVKKKIIPDLLVSTTPKEDNNAFLCEGKIWRTYRVDIAQGVCVRSSMME